jgi:membrane-associated protease RseP (regulator of RpoE activity)
MSSHKHLWSGDWQRDSIEPARPEPVSNEPPEPPASSPGRRSLSRRMLVTGGAVVVLLAAVGVTLALTLGGSSSPNLQAPSAAVPTTPLQVLPPQSAPHTVVPTQTVPQQATTQPAVQTQVTVGPTYGWLGMQISDTQSGVTVVTVGPDSAADNAGVNPGDVIESINGTQIESIAQLQKATQGLKLGNRFQLSVDRGSTPVTMTATLTGRPSRQS